MNSLYYILAEDGRTPVVCEDLMTWSRWFDDHNRRRVAFDEPCEGVEVSTVFLGFDHSFKEGGPPLLFETMVFGGPLDEEQVRYSTWDEAHVGHAEMVKCCKETGP